MTLPFAPPSVRVPRWYQEEAPGKLRESLARGNSRIVYQLPTGAGKTFIAAMIIRMALAKEKSVIFTAPAISLIDQTVEAFEAEGIFEIGVIQAQHPRTDYFAPVQVASVQTLARRIIPDADLVIIDEAHINSKVISSWMQTAPETIFVGLSATPWRKGMAKDWDDLIVGATITELIDAGHLSDYRVFAPTHPDLSGVASHAGDYALGPLSQIMQDGQMVADVVSTWLEKAEGRPTLCFAVDRAHARHLTDRFAAAGVSSACIESYTDPVERRLIQQRFEGGDVSVVCNVGCLTTGVDWDVRCIILARPTKSEMLYVQMIGRGLRTAAGKEDCLILDHSDNTERLGFVSDIHYDTLDDGTPKVRGPTDRQRLPKPCPKCSFVRPPKTTVCPACGHEVQPPSGRIDMADGDLVEVRGQKKRFSNAEKQSFYGQLLWVARDRGRADGWVSHSFRDRFGVWPKSMSRTPQRPEIEVLNFVKAKDIRFAKGRENPHAR